MTAAKHRIHVREATLADVPTMVDIHFASFGEDVINQLMYPGGPSEDVKAKFGTSLLPPSDTSQSSEIFVLVAELFPEDDPAGAGEIIAFAKWSLRRNPIPESEWNVKKTITAETLGEGINVDIYIWFIEFLHARLSELVRGDAMLCKRPEAALSRGDYIADPPWNFRPEDSCMLAQATAAGCRLGTLAMGYRVGRQPGAC